MSKNTLQPQIIDLMRSLKSDVSKGLNCVKIGRIQSFDGSKKTVQAQILFKRVMPDGTIFSCPVLVDCPVFTLQGGGAALQMPIAAGDQCILLFSDRNLDNWFSTGSEQPPANDRAHDLSDGIALVGVNSLASDLAAYDSHVNLRLPSGEKLVVSGGTAAEVLGTSLLALKSDVDAIMTFLGLLVTAFNAHVHTGVTTGPGSSGAPGAPFATTPPTMVGTTKLKGA